jgi:hypothetical protein
MAVFMVPLAVVWVRGGKLFTPGYALVPNKVLIV